MWEFHHMVNWYQRGDLCCKPRLARTSLQMLNTQTLKLWPRSKRGSWLVMGHPSYLARPKSPVVPNEQEQPGSCVRKHPSVLSRPSMDPPPAWFVVMQWSRLVGDKVTRGWKIASCWATPLFPHFMEASCRSVPEEMAINALAAGCHQH